MLLGIALLAASCRGDARPAATATPPTLTVVNETPCVIHVRFDNGSPMMRVAPHATRTLTDPALATFKYLKAESTMAIFRTFAMDEVRAEGWTATIRPAADDRPCVQTHE